MIQCIAIILCGKILLYNGKAFLKANAYDMLPYAYSALQRLLLHEKQFFKPFLTLIHLHATDLVVKGCQNLYL